MNSDIIENDTDIVPMENMKVLNVLKITRGYHVFELEICAQFF